MWGRIKMPTCHFCFAEHRLNVPFCPSCGASLLSSSTNENIQKIKCHHCATPNRGRASFCVHCGADLFEKSTPPQGFRQKTEQKIKQPTPEIKPILHPIDTAIIKKLSITANELLTIESGKITALPLREIIRIAQTLFGNTIAPTTIKKAYRTFALAYHPDNNKNSLTPHIDARIFNIGTIVKDAYCERVK